MDLRLHGLVPDLNPDPNPSPSPYPNPNRDIDPYPASLALALRQAFATVVPGNYSTYVFTSLDEAEYKRDYRISYYVSRQPLDKPQTPPPPNQPTPRVIAWWSCYVSRQPVDKPQTPTPNSTSYSMVSYYVSRQPLDKPQTPTPTPTPQVVEWRKNLDALGP